MAEPAPATVGKVTIVKAAGSYNVTPPTQTIACAEAVYFTSNPTCWAWTFVGTTAVNAFQNETNYYIPCPAGTGPAQYAASQYCGQTITVVPTDVGAPQPPPNVIESVRGTIKVSSMNDTKKEERR
jgi:hypothetical protein